ncbi:DUF3616 domain-containing protein [Calothrix sp. UHCC 0171]|uniref:DUF3616 domain-containing protein n=1 Tax=Calothrix sp. UHCC 0171 TaxID=3110245 RepID=UPI002B1F4FC3|nr:DUF3616 domain-containing protein [Calothrix sp. UHCC 0171]MEA5571494.1 DUF3616 domain-containing protein [Calothrix sp. UHCC 0171]
MYNSQPIQQILLKFNQSFQEHREDISAVLLSPEQHLWLGSDETSTIERLSLIDADNFAKHQQYQVADFISLPALPSEEIDIEGLAYDDYYLWFVGSHSYKRKKPKPEKTDAKNVQRLAKIATEPNRYILGRIPLVNGELLKSCPHPKDSTRQLSAAKLEITPMGNLLMEALADDPHLGAFIQAMIPGKDNGFDIEGIEAQGNRIFLGLRGPVLRGWAVILEIALEESISGLLKLSPIGEDAKGYKKHFLFLNGLGIRDLCREGSDLLILAGPTMDLDGPVQVYRLKESGDLQADIFKEPELALEIPYGNRDDHAEGITLFTDILGKSSLLVVYDSPSKTKRVIGEDSIFADVFSLETGK